MHDNLIQVNNKKTARKMYLIMSKGGGSKTIHS